MDAETRVSILSEKDVVVARLQGRQLASRLAFSMSELTLIATAISELARNIVSYAGQGEILLSLVQEPGRSGIVVVARDDGPGIANVTLALRDGFSTGGGLGLGLPGTRRLMDELEVSSELGKGTTVTARKWLR